MVQHPARSRRDSWRYSSEPEPQLFNRALPIQRGRVLGGSSSINGMVHVRGNRLDYDLMRQSGLDGWSFADVLPYFRRMEDHSVGHFRDGDGQQPCHRGASRRRHCLICRKHVGVA